MLDETICHQVFDFTTPKTILKSKLFAFEYQIDVINNWMFPSIKQFGLQVKLLGMLPSILWSSSNQQIVNSNSLHRFCTEFWVSNTNMLVLKSSSLLEVSNYWMFPSIKQFGLQVKLLGMLPSILWSSSNQQIVSSNSLHRFVLIFWSQIQTCQSKSRLL